MRILIAEDESVSRTLLEATVRKCGYEVVSCVDGQEALAALQPEEGPRLAILDWMMPKMDGIEVCRRIRETPGKEGLYVVLVTNRNQKEDLIQGLDAGADDYLVKPFDTGELCARLRVGRRVLELQEKLADRVRKLEDALSQVRQLRGLLPICSYCKAIRDDKNYWQRVESYLEAHSGAQFSHSVCPKCFDRFVQPELDALRQRAAREKAKG